MHQAFRYGFEKSAAPFAKFKPTVPKPNKGVGQWATKSPAQPAKQGVVEKTAKAVNIPDSEKWKTKWHPEGKERDTARKAIVSKLVKNKHRLSDEGLEELGMSSTSGDLMWHPRFLK